MAKDKRKQEIWEERKRLCLLRRDTKEFLQIDHVNNDGAEHRKQLGRGGSRLYQWLRKHNFPTGFQVLCANCNRGKALLGVCPHQLKVKGDQDGTLSVSGIDGRAGARSFATQTR
jgi:hypothetical protein